MQALEISPEEMDEAAADPVAFIEGVFGLQLWSKQVEIAESVRDNKRTAVRSCHSAGKTTIAAAIAVWWLLTHPNSNVITTAPTGRQVRNLLWKEVRRIYRDSPFVLGGNLLPKDSRIDMDADWFMLGYSTDSGDAFQGYHSEGGNLFVFDEAIGIDESIWKGANGCMTNSRDRFLAIGNPTQPSGKFYEMFGSDNVNPIHISAFDIPNVTERREVVPGLLSHEWVEEMQDECGSSYLQHPDYVSRVLGRFPDKDEHALVPISWFDGAVERWETYNDLSAWRARACVLGGDIARKGSARTVISESYDRLGARKLHKLPPQSTMDTVHDIRDLGRRVNAVEYRIDADGLGAGVYDRLAEFDQEEGTKKAVEMRGGMRAEDPTRYTNCRAEWYWSLRERLDPDCDAPLALPPDPKLRAQLTSIRWRNTPRGLKQIESKDEMAKRGMRSPDEADAVVYSLAAPAEPDFDPIAHLRAMTKM